MVAGDSLQPKRQLRATETCFRQLLENLLQSHPALGCSPRSGTSRFREAAPATLAADQSPVAAQCGIGVLMAALSRFNRGQDPLPLVFDGKRSNGLLNQIVGAAAIGQALLIEQVDPAENLADEARELGTAVQPSSIATPVGAAALQHLPGLAADQLRQLQCSCPCALLSFTGGTPRRLGSLTGCLGKGVDANCTEGADLNQAVGGIGVDQLIAPCGTHGGGADAHPGAGQNLAPVFTARNSGEVAVQFSPCGAPAVHPVSRPHIKMNPAPGRALDAGARQIGVEIQHAHPIPIQVGLTWIVLTVKINHHHIAGWDHGEPQWLT